MLFAMSLKVNRFPAFLAAALILSACSLHPSRGLKSCKYTFRSFTFLGMDAGQTHWQVDVAVANPNAHEVTLTRMRYALLYGPDTLLSGWNPEAKLIAAKDSAVLSTSLDLPNTLFTRLPPGIWSQTDARFPILADVYLHTWLGDIVVAQAVKDTVRINMVAQVAKYKEMLMRSFFKWPGRHLEDGGIHAPDDGPPRDDGVPPQPGSPAPDEHL